MAQVAFRAKSCELQVQYYPLPQTNFCPKKLQHFKESYDVEDKRIILVTVLCRTII